MHITRLEIGSIPPLGEIEFDCDEMVNLFIGPNASGKSTILRGLKHLCSLKPDATQVVESRHVYSHVFRSRKSSEYGDRKFSFEALYDQQQGTSGPKPTIWDRIPFLYVPATRVNLPPQDVFDETIYKRQPSGFGEMWYDKFDRHFSDSSGDFNGEFVEDAIDFARKEVTGNRSQRNQLRKALKLGYCCAKTICIEVMHDDVPQTYVELRDDEEEEEYEETYPHGSGFHPTGRIPHYGMGIVTTDDIVGEPLYAGALSSGTQGTLLWIYALALKMAYHYDWAEGWDKKPAILLIDEIENHLHPTWQRRVIPALQKHFPGLQIFATTHSPFVVAGLKTGQVHLLQRDENGIVTATTSTKDIIGWTADEILRTMMGVEEPTDQLTVDRANRLRQLREKETLTTEEESEMNGLRRQVNEDLLSKSGPLEAQRERYADLMQGFLLSRQSELSQDGE